MKYVIIPVQVTSWFETPNKYTNRLLCLHTTQQPSIAKTHSAGGELCSPPHHSATPTPKNTSPQPPGSAWRPRPPCTGRAELHSAGGELCSPPHHSTIPPALPKNTSPQPPGSAWRPRPPCTGRAELHSAGGELCSPPHHSTQPTSLPKNTSPQPPGRAWRPRPPCTGRAELHSAGGELCSPPHHSSKPTALPKNTSPQPPGRASVPARRVLGAPSCTRQEASFARLPTTPPNQHHSPKTLHRSPLGARASPPAVCWARRVALGRRRALLASPPLQQANSTPQKHFTAVPWARERPRPPCTGRAELHSAGGCELCSPPHHSTKPPALPKNTSPQPPGRASVPARRVLGAPSCTRQEASFARLPTTPPNQHHSPKTLHRSPLGARASPPAVYWVRRVALGRRRALLASPPLQQANSTPQKHLTAAPWARERPRPPCTGCAELHSAGGELCSPPHHSTKPPALPKNTSPQPPGRAVP